MVKYLLSGRNLITSSLLTLMVLSTLLSIVSTNALNTPNTVVGETELALLAVTRSGKTLVGTTMELKVIVTKGSGRVFLAVEPIAELDLQTSAKLAALVAANAVGKDFMRYNYFIELLAKAQVVGGPSAGAAIAVAIAAALTGKGNLLNKSVAITGVIMPDSTIGPVGGLPEKIEAAGIEGVKVVLIPKGQLIVKDPVTNKTVNILSIARKYGLRIIEVSDIYEALKDLGIITHLPQYRVSSLRMPKSVVNVMKSWVREFNETYPKLLSEVRSELGVFNASVPIGNYTLMKLITNLTREGVSLYKTACREVLKGSYYAAASDMFGAVIDLDTVRWLIKVFSSGDTSDVLKGLLKYVKGSVEEANEVLDELERSLLSKGYIDIAELSVLVEVSKRVYEANALLNELSRELGNVSKLGKEAVANFVGKAVYTRWRGKSAVSWSELINALPNTGLNVTKYGIDESATLLTHYSQVSTSYISTFLSSKYSAFTNELSKEVRDASKYLGNDPVMSLAICMSSLARVAAALNTMFSLNLTSKALMLRDEVVKAIAHAEAVGMFPLVALTYLERGDSVLSKDSVSAIYFYDLALTNTVWYILMAKQVRSVGITALSTESSTNVGLSSGFKYLINYLATLALGALIGSLITYAVLRRRLSNQLNTT